MRKNNGKDARYFVDIHGKLLNKDGELIGGNKQSGYYVKITKSGKIIKISEGDYRYKPRTASSFKMKITGKKQTKHLQNKPRGKFRISDVGDLESIGSEFAVRTKRLALDTHKKLIYNVSVGVIGEDGESKFVDIQFDFGQTAENIRNMSAVDDDNLRTFFMNAFHSNLAKALTSDHQVTTGSASFIEQLPENEDLDPDEWTNSSGNSWGKHNFEKVDIQSIEVQVQTYKIAH